MARVETWQAVSSQLGKLEGWGDWYKNKKLVLIKGKEREGGGMVQRGDPTGLSERRKEKKKDQ